jgi:two-component system response regulator YesN
MLKVLIVEDEDIIRKGIAYTFDWLSMGCVIVGEAADGVEGEEKILELKPDIVLADIKMPRQSGMEMLSRTRGRVNYKSLLLTSYAEFDYARQAIDLKVSDYLLKPVKEDDLRKVILRVRTEIESERETDLMRQKNESSFELSDYLDLARQENPYVLKLLEIIQERYAQKLSIEEIAEEIGVSASYLSRKFKQITGHTYLDFLNSYRLSQAVKLLQSGAYKVYEISDMTGFTDYKHFSAVFKKYTGVSPTEFTKTGTSV